METNHTLPGPVREFIDRIPSARFFRPQKPEEWMRIECFSDWLGVVQAAYRAPYNTAHYGPRNAVYRAARDAARDADWDAAYEAAWDAAYRTAWNAASSAARCDTCDIASEVIHNAACGAASSAADYAAALVVADLIDSTPLYRWWRAWELGYIPIREDGDSLVVGCPRRLRRNDHR